MEVPRSYAEQQHIKKPVHRLCNQYFDLAVSLYLRSPEKGYIFTAEEAGAPCEYISLLQDGRISHLYRPAVEHAGSASFPYWLRTTLTAINPETNLPELISQTYRLDHQGTFHQEIQHGHETMLAPVNDAMSMQLELQLIGSEVAYVKPRAAAQQT